MKNTFRILNVWQILKIFTGTLHQADTFYIWRVVLKLVIHNIMVMDLKNQCHYQTKVITNQLVYWKYNLKFILKYICIQNCITNVKVIKIFRESCMANDNRNIHWTKIKKFFQNLLAPWCISHNGIRINPGTRAPNQVCP